MTMDQPIVALESVKKHFDVRSDLFQRLAGGERKRVKAVDGVSFAIGKGEVFGLAGESGSGKTTVGKIILGLERPTGGTVLFEGADIARLGKRGMKAYRRRAQVIFQDPYASLNPRMKVGKALAQPLEIHRIGNAAERKEKVLRILERVGLTPPEFVFSKYPHQLSGGQRQRVVIARALILHPDFVVADEPIAMADVSMRVLLLDLMMDLKSEFDLTYLFITHDLATAKYVCDRIAVMYLGRIVEFGSLGDVYRSPLHPYTEALIAAVPAPDPDAVRTTPIPKGEIPNPISPPPGCRFHPRCIRRMAVCCEEPPPLTERGEGHFVECWLHA